MPENEEQLETKTEETPAEGLPEADQPAEAIPPDAEETPPEEPAAGTPEWDKQRQESDERAANQRKKDAELATREAELKARETELAEAAKRLHRVVPAPVVQSEAVDYDAKIKDLRTKVRAAEMEDPMAEATFKLRDQLDDLRDEQLREMRQRVQEPQRVQSQWEEWGSKNAGYDLDRVKARHAALAREAKASGCLDQSSVDGYVRGAMAIELQGDSLKVKRPNSATAQRSPSTARSVGANAPPARETAVQRGAATKEAKELAEAEAALSGFHRKR